MKILDLNGMYVCRNWHIGSNSITGNTIGAIGWKTYSLGLFRLQRCLLLLPHHLNQYHNPHWHHLLWRLRITMQESPVGKGERGSTQLHDFKGVKIDLSIIYSSSLSCSNLLFINWLWTEYICVKTFVSCLWFV